MKLTTGRACSLAFVVAFAALFLQVLVHRIISAKLLNDYAFLVISLTMLGFAAAGALLSVTQRAVLSRPEVGLTVASAAASLSALLATVCFYATDTQAAYVPHRPAFVSSFFDWAPFALLYAVPFAFLGLVLGALLSARDLATKQVYFADLMGSALGAVAVLPAIRHFGVERSLLALAFLLPVAALWLLRPTSRWARGSVLLATAATALVAVGSASLLDMRPAKGSPAAMLRTGPKAPEEYIRWDPLARVELTPIPPPDPQRSFYNSPPGRRPRVPVAVREDGHPEQLRLRLRGALRRPPESFAGVDQTLYAAAYVPRGSPPSRVVAIGVGGGFDILTALRFGAGQVTGVEVNATVLRLLTRDRRDYFKAWVDDPRVRLVHDEGRHFLSTNQEPRDVIQLSGVDSYSGTPGAAHVFSENYLYTLEAFELYLSRLSDDGILHMMRLEHNPAREMLRALATAVAALRARGVADPAAHVVTLTARRGNITSLLVKRQPFTAEELGRIEQWCARSPHFGVSARPGGNAAKETAYQAFLAQGSREREEAFAAAYPFDIDPTVDDRPFFFRASRWWHLFPADATVWTAVPVMEMSLLLLLGAVGLAAFLVVGLPLRLLPREGRPRGLLRFGLFFVCIGLGFMAIEMALLQRFGLVLGHPGYALSVVLASLLFGSGLGALYSSAIVARLGGLRFTAYALCAVVIAQVLLLPRPAVLVAQPFAVRAALVVLLTGTAGALMGVFFPAGLDRLKERSPSYVPWAWGVNGIASVLAPILSIGLAITFGNTLLILAALPLYLLAGVLLPAAANAA